MVWQRFSHSLIPASDYFVKLELQTPKIFLSRQVIQEFIVISIVNFSFESVVLLEVVFN